MWHLMVGATLVAVLSSQSPAQQGFKWFAGAGPSAVTHRGYLFLSSDPFNVTAADTLLLGGARGRGAATIGVARRLASSALNARLDATYQLASSSSGPVLWPFGQIVRAARRDESVGLHAGLEWNAVPNSAWSPYLLTSAGLVGTRMRWSTDSSMARPNRTTFTRAFTGDLGFGIRGSILGTNIFVETRRQWSAFDWADSRKLPLIVGVRMR